ncbi:MAG: transporter substrate-binding domain-containing protein [Tannerella sp.]|jgi:membrane-bound lytic murein transglycosylase F|nr:transporter substrate-binding domain-containing protein [Tannerella sp.]
MMYARLFSSLFILLLLGSCGPKSVSDDFPTLAVKGEITAVTLNTSTAYFLYKMQPMGYEYDLIADFAQSNNLKLNIKVAENVTRLTEMLLNHEADVVAYPMQVNNQRKQEVLYCGHERQSNLVIVQRANRGDTILNDVTQLIGKQVYVKPNSRYHERLENLNRELGGGIQIMDIQRDTVTAEDLIEMVARGALPYTVCEDDVARLNRTYFQNINISLTISFKQRYSWIVNKDAPLLAQAINEWASNNTGKSAYQAASKRYFEISKNYSDGMMPEVVNGQLSLYDSLFQCYASKIGWDWRLVASISYEESHFEPARIAWTGAEGLMGIMPTTAAYFGYAPEDMKYPDKNIAAGTKCLKFFGSIYADVPDSMERIKFCLAAYNAGAGHVNDARALAGKYGKDPNMWDDVAEYIRLKSEPEYFNDPVCKNGYMRGVETIKYVYEVMERYDYYKGKMQKQ